MRSSEPKRPTADVIQDFEAAGEVSPPSLPIRNVTMLMLQHQLLTQVFKRLRSAGGHVKAPERRRSREDWEFSPAEPGKLKFLPEHLTAHQSKLNIPADRTEVMDTDSVNVSTR